MGDMESLRTLFLRYRVRGDSAALAELFDRTSPGLLRIARALRSRAADAEDLLQATYLKAIESADRFDADRDLEPWLLGILVNEARNRRRGSAGWGENVGPEPGASPITEPEVRASHEEARGHIARGLESLPTRYREVLEPFLAEDASGVEIAQRLGRSAGTVRMQIHRGLILLRRLLPAGLASATLGLIAPRAGSLPRVRAAVLGHVGAVSVHRTLLPGLLMKNIKLCLAVTLLLVVGLGGLWMRTRPGTTVVADPPQGRDGSSDSAATRNEGLAHGPAFDGIRTTPPPTKQEAPESAPTATELPEDRGHIRVVFATTGQPVPGQTVVLLDLARLPDDQLLGFESGGAELQRILEVHGSRAITDELGQADLATWSETPILVACSTSTHGAMEIVGPEDPRPVVLEMEEAPPVRVRVIDSSGEPAIGVPIGIQVVRGGRARTIFVAATEAPMGEVELRHVRGAALLAGGADEIWVGPDLLLATPLREQVQPGAVPPWIEFTLPPTGSLKLLLEDEGGSPVRGTYRVTVEASPQGAGSPSPTVATGTFVGGSCEFNHVGLGLDLDVHVQSSAYAKSHSRHTGPNRRGQQLELLLPSRGLPILRATVVNSEGPVADQGLRLVLKDEAAEDSQRRSIVTDEFGTFDFELPRFYDTGSRSLEIRHEGANGGRARLDLSRLLGVGVHDLGKVQLASPPFLIGGRVTDSEGLPISGAHVRFFHRKERRGSYIWNDLRELDGTTDPEGYFEVRGWVDESPLSITADHPRFARGERMPVQRGEENILYALEEPGSLTGVFVDDPGVPTDTLQIILDEGPGSGIHDSAPVKYGDPFNFRGLLEGTYRLSLRLGTGELIELRDPVNIDRGQETDLGSLDTRGRLNVHGVRVQDAWGSPAPGVLIHFRPGGESPGQWRSRRTLEDGSVQWTSSHDVMDVQVSPGSSRTLEFPGVSGVTTVRLNPPGDATSEGR